MLAVEGVSIQLGGRTILRDVGFRVQPGEFTGLIGPNGSGKTTLLRILLGLTRPDSGTVTVAGQGRSARGRRVGYVPQKVLLDPDIPLRARDVVELGLGGRRFGIGLPSASRRKLVDEMLEAVDATRFADHRIGLLSGGEQQRVLIAHALISRPNLLLLDEPLANLDLASANEIVRLLSRIAREQRVAVLLSAHEMNPLLPVTDRIVYIAHGRAASGSVDEVITTDVLSHLYGHPVDVVKVRGRVLVVADTDPTTTDFPGSDPAEAQPAEPGSDAACSTDDHLGETRSSDTESIGLASAATCFTVTQSAEPAPDATELVHADPAGAHAAEVEPDTADSTNGDLGGTRSDAGGSGSATDPVDVDLGDTESGTPAPLSTSNGADRTGGRVSSVTIGPGDANPGETGSGTPAATGPGHDAAEIEESSANGSVEGVASSRGV